MGALAVAAAACAGPVYHGRYAWDRGWRQAVVIDPSVGAGQRAQIDCRSILPASAASSREFARVHYHSGRDFRSMIAMAPQGEPLQRGQVVYVDPADCGEEIGR